MTSLSPDQRLAVYGTLAPGRSNHDQLEDLQGTWRPGFVQGHLVASGWGAAEGYPGIRLDPEAPRVDVQVLESPDLPDHWPRLDEFEGEEYERMVVTVACDGERIEASIYALRPEPKS
jgi:gamma-glutamylcyclotransferase (GGCT)/AIG2-like uncharacterized protein YtfP